MTGELSVRPGAHGFQDVRAAGRDGRTEIPLAIGEGPEDLALGGVALTVTRVTLTPRGVRLDFCATGPGRTSGTRGERVRSGCR
jgi:hypothetical protein